MACVCGQHVYRRFLVEEEGQGDGLWCGRVGSVLGEGLHEGKVFRGGGVGDH